MVCISITPLKKYIYQAFYILFAYIIGWTTRTFCIPKVQTNPQLAIINCDQHTRWLTLPIERMMTKLETISPDKRYDVYLYPNDPMPLEVYLLSSNTPIKEQGQHSISICVKEEDELFALHALFKGKYYINDVSSSHQSSQQLGSIKAFYESFQAQNQLNKLNSVISTSDETDIEIIEDSDENYLEQY